MNKTLRKITASIMAITTLAVGMTAISANAASWSASHVSGAPGSASTTATLTVAHKAAGATAYCNYNTHTNTTAVTGYTRIDCTNYSMTQKQITNTGSVICNPSVGSPTTNISVGYKVSAYTPSSNDTFWTKGNIIAR